MSTDRHEAVENCRRAMRLAHRELDVPMVLEPEYLASPWLDELSGMTYLSYFMKPDSAGFRATLDWVNSRLERGITNFTVPTKVCNSQRVYSILWDGVLFSMSNGVGV